MCNNLFSKKNQKNTLQLGLTPWSARALHDTIKLCAQAKFAEKLGYSYFFLPEHHFSGEWAIPEPLLVLAAVAATTQRIRIGTTSYLLPLRNPIQAAEQVAVLDQLSNGRLTLGIGRGASPSLFNVFDIDPRAKRKLFENSFRTMLDAWDGKPVSKPDSEEVIRIAPLTRQKPHPPIWVAAFGPLALQQAGRLGLPYFASPRESRSQLVKNYSIYTRASEDAGRPKSSIVPVMRSIFVADDESLVSRVREQMNRGFRGPATTSKDHKVLKLDDWAIIGTPTQVQDLLGMYAETIPITHLIATRLGISGLSSEQLQRSLATLIELFPNESSANQLPQS